jgi:uncharacterized protein
MPTNLPPEYYEIERRFRAAASTEEKAATLEEMLSVIPKHKGTDHLRADLRRKLSRLKSTAHSRKTASGRRSSEWRIDREGAGQAILIGPANTGKSALLAALTNAEPEVSEAPFTTWRPTPGMLQIEDIQIQLVDTPPVDREFVEAEMIELLRRADLLLLVLDLQANPFDQLELTVAFLESQRIIPGHRWDGTPAHPPVYPMRCLVLLNKVDEPAHEVDMLAFCELVEDDWTVLPLSAMHRRHDAQFQAELLRQLDVIRVYSKAPGKAADLTAPFVLKRGSTVQDLAGKVHQDFVRQLRLARVWGSADHDGQLVGRDFQLSDGDIVELRI